MADETSFESVPKALHTPIAIEYAELQIIQGCLQQAGEAFGQYEALLAKTDEEVDPIIKTALWTHGLISMMSCFSKTGDEHRLIPKNVFGGIGNWEIVYNWLHDYRDSFAAHNFGPARQAEVAIVVHPDTGEVLGVGHIGMTFSGPAAPDMVPVKEFFQVTWKHVVQRVAEVHQILLNEASKMPREELLALPTAQIRMPAINELRTSRKRFREKAPQQPKPTD